MTLTEALKKYPKELHLFHGSPNSEILVLEPRPASDVDKSNTFNNDTAVFASDNITSCVLFAVMRDRSKLPNTVRDGTWSVYWEEDNSVTAEIPKKWQPHLPLITGYLYILPKETFLENKGNQWKSKEVVKPIAKIKVNFQDYLDLGGNVTWTKE